MNDSSKFIPSVNIYVDKPGKKQKNSYEKLSTKLYEKNHEFTDKSFQKTRQVSTKENILDSFSRIGRNLKHVSRSKIPEKGLDKVCLILMNNFRKEEFNKYDPPIGQLNDGYLVALIHHRLGFKVFYLYNCTQGNYPKWLQFFMNNTTSTLTVFYSGHNTNGIEFKDKYVTIEQLSHLINENNNCKCKTIFISECLEGGSVFNIDRNSRNNNTNEDDKKKMISLSIEKETKPNSRESKLSHGIFTYYLCKYIYGQPNITLKNLSEQMDPSVQRFKARFICETNNDELSNQPIFE